MDDQPVELTRTESDLLAALAARPRTALGRREFDRGGLGKLGDDAGAARFIRTVRGIGDRMGDG